MSALKTKNMFLYYFSNISFQVFTINIIPVVTDVSFPSQDACAIIYGYLDHKTSTATIKVAPTRTSQRNRLHTLKGAGRVEPIPENSKY